MSHSIKYTALAVGFAAALASSGAAAKVVNYSPCLDAAGQGWGGLTCTVAPKDFSFPDQSKKDKEVNVEFVLAHVFGEPVDVQFMAAGSNGLKHEFDDEDDDDEHYGGKTPYVMIELEQAYDFMTFRAEDLWGIVDVRGLTDFTFTTDDLIESGRGKAVNISQVSFWNTAPVASAAADRKAAPEPATLVLLGAGLLGLGYSRRHRR